MEAASAAKPPPYKIVGVVGVAIEKGGEETEKFTLLDDFSFLCEHWRTKGRECDSLQLNKPSDILLLWHSVES